MGGYVNWQSTRRDYLSRKYGPVLQKKTPDADDEHLFKKRLGGAAPVCRDLLSKNPTGSGTSPSSTLHWKSIRWNY